MTKIIENENNCFLLRLRDHLQNDTYKTWLENSFHRKISVEQIEYLLNYIDVLKTINTSQQKDIELLSSFIIGQNKIDGEIS